MPEFTTDFEAWLEKCGPLHADEAHDIEQALLHAGEERGGYIATDRGGAYVLRRGESDVALCFTNAESLDDFFELLRAPYRFDLDAQRWLDAVTVPEA